MYLYVEIGVFYNTQAEIGAYLRRFTFEKNRDFWSNDMQPLHSRVKSRVGRETGKETEKDKKLNRVL